MSFPASVSQVTLTKPQQGQPLPRRRPLPGEDELPDPREPSAEVGIGGPALDFGRDGGVSLERRGRQWGWTWLSERDERVKLEVAEDATMIFPPMRASEIHLPVLPLEVLVKSAEDYLTAIPELEHPALLMDQVQPELLQLQHERKRPRYDPFVSTQLAVLRNERAGSAKSALISPSGELGHHLVVSPFVASATGERSGSGNTCFTPIMKPLERFETEILQICSVDRISPHRLDRHATPLVVRLHSTTHYMNLIPNQAFVPPTDAMPYTTLRIGSIKSSETGGLRHVDAALDTTQWGRGVVVDESGGVWLFWEEIGEKFERQNKVFNIKKIRESTTDQREQFFRVAFGIRPDTVLVVSSREASIIDIGSPDYPVTQLIELTGRNRVFTSLDPTALERGASYTCLSTTYEVLWIDECCPGVPAASWKHDLGAGKARDLEVRTVLAETGECTLIYWRSKSLVTAVHVTPSPPIRSAHPPYVLAVSGLHGPLESLTTITIQRKHRRPSTLLISLARDGSVWSSPLTTNGNHLSRNELLPSSRRSELRVRLDGDEDALRESKPHHLVGSEEAITRYRELDMRWAWLEINRHDDGDDTEFEARFSIASFESYMRELDAPFEHLMTASDLARDLLDDNDEDEDGRKIRCQLLRPIPIRSVLARDLSRLDEVAYDRHFTVVGWLGRKDHPEGQHEGSKDRCLPDIDELLQSFPDGSTRTREDAYRLALDLALSKVVLSSDSIQPPRLTANATMLDVGSPESLMARVTLNDQDTIPVTFGFLTPHFPELEPTSDPEESLQRDTESIDRPDSAFESPSLRSLLTEWPVGELPDSYTWRPWRETDEFSTPYRPYRPIRPLPSSPRQSPNPNRNPTSASEQAAARTRMPSNPLRSVLSVPNLAPPVPMAFSSPPQEALGTYTQESLGGDGGIEAWTSTQVERGRFGGRPGDKGKKKIKKRVGGF